MDDAQSLARALAARIGARSGAACRVFDLPARAPGEVPRAGVGVEHGGAVRVVALVSALSIGRSVVHLAERDGVARLVAARAGGDRDADALAARVSGPLVSGILERVPVSALDIGYALAVGLEQTLRVDGSWFCLTTYGEWSEGPSGSGTTVEVGGANAWPRFAWVAQEPTGVTVSVPGAALGANRPSWSFAAPAEVGSAFGELLIAVKHALEARAAWRARPFPLRVAGERVAEVLRDARLGPGELRYSHADHGDFPVSFPSMTLWRVDAIGEHVCVKLTESESGVAIRAGRSRFVAADRDALEAILAPLVDAVREAESRLSPDKLVPGQLYRVLLDLPGAPPGTVLCFERTEHVVYDGFDIYHFQVPAEARAIALYAIDPAVEQALPELERYLERA